LIRKEKGVDEIWIHKLKYQGTNKCSKEDKILSPIFQPFSSMLSRKKMRNTGIQAIAPLPPSCRSFFKDLCLCLTWHGKDCMA